ncbi:AAA family ATPase [Strigomonas culicis]|uniref:AAA family ATPase n=1 Tax=Strigomonas culicis TaxID=28005 RepID=S9VE81_9TRYP|nr:AAA family ATPase [Strigomonas culicis]|eukprot:EPY21425.1 AAA family ATPase [Strigomonas culicis]
MAARGLNVRVVAAAPHRDALDAALVAPSLLGQHVVTLFPPSTAAEREMVFCSCLSQVGAAVEGGAVAAAAAEVAAHGHGFTQRDLFRLAEASVLEAVRRDGRVEALTAADIHTARRAIRPSSLQQFDVAIPEVTWADIGGSAEAKRTLQEVVAWCLGKQAWLFQEFRLTPPKGVLLYGPPGCSKTMLAKALANESRMNFISVKGPEVFSKWVGDSEKAVRDIFARARAVAPCVVFIDELDGMCGHRGSGGVSDRVISQFLTELDGLPAAFSEKSNALIFVAATNRPDNIDGAVLRPGRIDRCVHVGLPTQSEREAIVAIQFRRMPTEAALTARFVAERTEGYTGAEVVAVVKEAAFTAISEDAMAEQLLTRHVLVALRKVTPRISAADVQWYKQWATRGRIM